MKNVFLFVNHSTPKNSKTLCAICMYFVWAYVHYIICMYVIQKHYSTIVLLKTFKTGSVQFAQRGLENIPNHAWRYYKYLIYCTFKLFYYLMCILCYFQKNLNCFPPSKDANEKRALLFFSISGVRFLVKVHT